MSPIGRIFIVLNLFLSAAFLGWAANAVATNQQWKTRHDTVKAESDGTIKERDATIASLNANVSQEETETANQRSRADQAEALVASLRQQLASAQSTNKELTARIEGIDATLGDFEKRIGQITSDHNDAVAAKIAAETARDDSMDAQMAAEEAQREAEERLAGANAMIADLEASGAAQGSEISRLETELATLVDQTGVSVAELMPLPFIEGKVLAYRDDLGGLVTLNVGDEDGVKRGFTFEIFEGGTYKGRVRVQDVRPTMCSALVEDPVEGRQIGVGDNAATRL